MEPASIDHRPRRHAILGETADERSLASGQARTANLTIRLPYPLPSLDQEGPIEEVPNGYFHEVVTILARRKDHWFLDIECLAPARAGGSTHKASVEVLLRHGASQ